MKVWVEKVFRGVKHPKPVLIESASYKPDYKLIPKDQEESYCRLSEVKDKSAKILPKTLKLPPILAELIKRDILAKGEKITEQPTIEAVYNKSMNNSNYRIAKDGEKPTVSIPVGLGTPVSPGLYADVKL